MVYSPLSFVIEPVKNPVDSFLTWIVAPITDSPLLSTTVPVIMACVPCANRRAGKQLKNNKQASNLQVMRLLNILITIFLKLNLNIFYGAKVSVPFCKEITSVCRFK